MGLAGRLEGIAPSDIFQIISQSRMTGTLIARSEEGTAMVVFKDGQVIEAASDAPRESLAHVLVSQGIMTRETIEAAQARLKQQPERSLGAILVDMGAISARTLETVSLKQIEHIVHRLVSCEDGFITFDRGETALKRKLNTREFMLPAGVSAEYLMMERVRVMDEERRTGEDRRSRPRGPLAGSEPAAAAGAPGEKGASRMSAALLGLAARFRGIRLPEAADLRAAAETAVARIRAFSPDGRAMMYVGIAGIAAGLALILLTTLSFEKRQAGSILVVSRPVVNIRARPSTEGKVIAQTKKGETLSHISSREGWHKVRTKDGGTGWISQKLAERKEARALSFQYDMRGFELVLIAGLALLITGIMRKRGAARQETGSSH